MMATGNAYRRIVLTPAEAELWDWACDPMHEFWADGDERTHDGDRAYEAGAAIIEAKDGVGLIVDDPSVADDLIYRVETQMGQMADEQGGHDHRGRADRERMHALRCIATGKRLAAKIRAAFGDDDA